MNSPTQLHLIYKLDAMRKIIAESTDLPTILAIAQKVYDISFPVPIDPSSFTRLRARNAS